LSYETDTNNNDIISERAKVGIHILTAMKTSALVIQKVEMSR